MKSRGNGAWLPALLGLALASGVGAADVKLPQVSPAASVTQDVGLNEMKIVYHRPGVKGRKIWGGLVPENEVWRTGANEATTISFTRDVTIDGKDVPAGTYALFTIPSGTEWTVIVNKDARQWGGFQYKESDDVVRFKVRPVAAPFEERMSFRFDDPGLNSARVVLHWEKVEVPFTVSNKVDTNSVVLGSLREAIAAAKPDDWQALSRAASYCQQNKVNPEKAMAWIDRSIKIKDTTQNHFVKAELLEQAGRTGEAVAEAGTALKLATPQDEKGLTAEIRKMVGDWEKKGK